MDIVYPLLNRKASTPVRLTVQPAGGISEIGRKALQGRWFESIEDQPDVLVRRSPDAIEEGRDEQLERAVEHLLGQLGGPAMKR